MVWAILLKRPLSNYTVYINYRVRIEPHPDNRLNSLRAELDTVNGKIRSFWKHTEDGIRYEIETPTETEIVIDGVKRIVGKGKYIFGG